MLPINGYLIPIFAVCQVVGDPCDLCYNFSPSSTFFISHSDPFLPTVCRCRVLLQHLITLNDTHTHTIDLLWTRDRPAAETST